MKAITPTAAELAILRVLWRSGPCTVHDVHAVVYGDTRIGYTSALKLMQNMLAKGLVTRVEDDPSTGTPRRSPSVAR
jgi:BlaI family transcriptional regulator, penicillinase repressor